MSTKPDYIDPELGSDIVELGMVRDVTVGADGRVSVTIALTTAGCPLRGQIQRDVKARLGSLPGVTGVHLHWTELDRTRRPRPHGPGPPQHRGAARDDGHPADREVIMIASGKGGVGKSSVTVNLAAALAAEGFAVGVIDADIWGFSVPRMLGLEGRLRGASRPDERKIAPIET